MTWIACWTCCGTRAPQCLRNSMPWASSPTSAWHFATRPTRSRPAGNGFPPFALISQAHKQAPPIEDQRDVPGGDLATQQVLGHKASPAPLVLEFVEVVLHIRPISIKLREAQNLFRQR